MAELKIKYRLKLTVWYYIARLLVILGIKHNINPKRLFRVVRIRKK